MRRALVTVLALLLLALQHEILVHPLAHLGSRFSASHETSLAPTQAIDACVECALLTAGGNAMGSAPPLVHHEPPASTQVARVVTARAAEAPAWFRSRAPPVLL